MTFVKIGQKKRVFWSKNETGLLSTKVLNQALRVTICGFLVLYFILRFQLLRVNRNREEWKEV